MTVPCMWLIVLLTVVPCSETSCKIEISFVHFLNKGIYTFKRMICVFETLSEMTNEYIKKEETQLVRLTTQTFCLFG